MGEMTRKDFLRYTAGAAMSSLSGIASGTPAVAQTEVSGRGRVGSGRMLIRGADVLTMDSALGEVTAGDVLIDGGKIAAVGHALPAGGAEVMQAKGMIPGAPKAP